MCVLCARARECVCVCVCVCVDLCLAPLCVFYSYERHYPMTQDWTLRDAAAPVYITVGNGGKFESVACILVRSVSLASSLLVRSGTEVLLSDPLLMDMYTW